MKIININEDVSSYFFKDENLKNEFKLANADKLEKLENNNKKIQLGYFVKYNAIATYQGNKINNITFYMPNWKAEKVHKLFKARIENKNFNLYHIKSVRVEKIY
jgi:hypothetical protein